MANPSSMRKIQLLNGLLPDHPFISATVYRDFPTTELEQLEKIWAKARETLSVKQLVTGLNPLEHSHWDWRNKIESVEIGRHMLVTVAYETEIQGIMAIERIPRSARLSNGSIIYVDYLESARWNLKQFANTPRFIGVGTSLIAEAIRIGVEAGLNGRVGLHSLPQAEGFYSQRCRMTRVGLDPGYFDLPYYEYADQQATDWLVSIGETL
jgi:hypothetical protein